MKHIHWKISSRFRSQSWILIYQLFLAVVLPVVFTWLLLQFNPYPDIQNIVLLYLIPVFFSTFIGGLTAGLTTGFLSFLAFDYFFIPPYSTLVVHKSSDLVTLLMFLLITVVISQLVGQARSGMQIARKREAEARRIYELISDLFTCKDCREISSTLLKHICSSVEYKKVLVRVFEPDGCEKNNLITSEVVLKLEPPDLIMPMKSSHQTEGEVQYWGNIESITPAELRLLNAFCSEGALALERIRLTGAESLATILTESDRVKTAILNSVSHELRSPLAAIKASVSSLRNGTVEWSSDARLDLLSTIEEETDMLNILVGNLLDMSRIESGSLKPKIRWESISEIAKGMAIKMRSSLQNHELVFNFSQSADLVPCDYVMVGQVFTNLISNSVKYSPANTKINIKTFQEGDELRVEITNQSPKIPAESLNRIFEKFYRITNSDKTIGTGLGLSICKGIIEAHGGRIWAENRQAGFTFVFSLPMNLNGTFPDVPMEG